MRVAMGHDQKNEKRPSDLDLLAELQHYGAATCLIDFTYNAMTALWFACQPSSERYVNGKVVAVDLHRSHRVDDTKAKKDIGCFFTQNVEDGYQLYHWQPKNQNNRIIAQRSIFIFGSFTIETGAECIIPKKEKLRILHSLESTLGITEASLFPDFDGFATQRAHNKEYTGAHVSGYIDHAEIALNAGQLDEAIKFCTEGISLQPDNIDVGFLLLQRAKAYKDKSEHDNAIKDCNEVMKLDESNYLPFHLKLSLNLRAQIYENKGEYRLAIEDYSKIIELAPENAEAHYDLGRVKKNLNCITEAKSDLQKLSNLE